MVSVHMQRKKVVLYPGTILLCGDLNDFNIGMSIYFIMSSLPGVTGVIFH